MPSSQIFGKVYYKENTSQKMVALTFDDGPNDPYTSQILDVLEHYNVKATFFIVGKNVELYPQTAERILADGNVVGNHSYSHNANHALTEYGVHDMQRGEQAIYDTVGVKPRLYRPPHGKLSPWEIHYVREEGMIEVTWTVESPELAGWSGTQEAQDIVNKTRPGDIILLHDGYGTEHNDKHADKSATVEAVPIIIEKLEAEGYTFVTVPQLLDVAPYLN
jgi:peptidoglycan/xylan/chitin deacetylase (PgdA/CDA1 family)